MDKLISLIMAVLLGVFGYWGYIAQHSEHGQKILLSLDVDHVDGKPWIKKHEPLMRE